MKTKYYFRTQHSPGCYSLNVQKAIAKEEGLTEIELYKAIPEKVEGYIWCTLFEITEKGYCGRNCGFYSPKNLVSGICQNQGRFYDVGEKIKIQLK